MNTEIIDIRKTASEKHLNETVSVIRESFKTVAEDFGITAENAPTNPAFITDFQFSEYLKREVNVYGLVKNSSLIGCIAVEKAADRPGFFYIERLAVIPSERHNGYGRQLLDFSFSRVSDLGGDRIEIGIIDSHAVLKNWYIEYGFSIIGTRQYDHLPFDVCFLGKNTGI